MSRIRKTKLRRSFRIIFDISVPSPCGRVAPLGAGWGHQVVKRVAKHKNRPQAHKRAKALRQSGSVIEKLLHKALRQNMKAFDVRFRYQHPIDPYIVDFACLPARLVVEIDGMSHDASVVGDENRQRYLEQQGFTVMRFANADVVKDPASVAVTMCERASELLKLRQQQTPPRSA
jgi:very-short-patch-repair endonuclease